MIRFWQLLREELEERIAHLKDERDLVNARALEDAYTRAGWVEIDLSSFGNDDERTRQARRVYASWKAVYVDGVAREHLDEAEASARIEMMPF